MLYADYIPYTLCFREQARTSRSVMRTHKVWYIRVWDEATPEIFGIGECAPLEGLSPEDNQYYEKILAHTCRTINAVDAKILRGWSSIRFGVETALADLKNGGKRQIYDTPWYNGVGALTINGLIWMGSEDQMLARINDKLAAGFRCLKLKIGGIDFDGELRLLQHIREAFGPDVLEIRLDANCAFGAYEAMDRLERLSRFSIHSIEQPIARRLWADMARLCRESPIPIALDEELIGVSGEAAMCRLLDELPEEHAGRQAILEMYKLHVGGLADRQNKDGFWHHLLDRNDSYPETSATAIFAYCIAHGVNSGWVDAVTYGPVAQLAWEAVSTKINDRGEVEDVCVGTGMGFEPAYYYYRPVSAKAAHGYGPVIWAGAEMVRMLESSYPRINDSAVHYYRKDPHASTPIFSLDENGEAIEIKH